MTNPSSASAGEVLPPNESPLQELGKDRRRSFEPLAAASAATFLILLTSVLGLLCLRLDLYDDSAMMLGARLVRAGQRPYLDFYTHYGPLIYNILSLFLHIPANPAVVLRLSQCLFLLFSSGLLIVLARRQPNSRPILVTGVPVTALAVSAVFQLPAFLAFFFCYAALSLVARLQTTPERNGRLLEAGGGLALGLAALVRPAFAAYVGGSLAILLVLVFRTGGESSERRRIFCVGAVAVASMISLWLLLYRAIPLTTLWSSAFRAPAHLMGSGARLLRPDFFPAVSGMLGSAIVMSLGGAVIFASTVAWLLVSSPRGIVLVGLAASLVAGTVSLILLNANTTGRGALLVAMIWFSFATAIVILARHEIRSSRSLRAAAPFGLVSAAFSHYFWARPDRPHLILLLSLAVTGAALVSGTLDVRRRIALGLLFAVAYVSLWRIPWSPFPAMHLFNGGVTRILEHARLPRSNWQSIWPAGELPANAVSVVSLADRHASPTSRFVAVASSQAQTSGNPVLLFLLSRRLPYTKWWAYDPGVQSSPEIQKEMEKELRTSASDTAVVWPTEQYFFEPPEGIDPMRPTEFDEDFLRLYPRLAARVGEYEVRLRH